METKERGNQLIFSKEPINVGNAITMTGNYEWHLVKDLPPLRCTVYKTSRKILRWMTLGDRQHSRFMKQLVMLKYNPKHYEVILRCVRYGNKVPRKYMRMYKEVIKRIIITKNYGKNNIRKG